MKLPEKVVITCTADEHVTTVYAGEEVLFEERFNMKSRGSARQVGRKQPDVCEVLGDFNDLADEIDSLSTSPFGISGALWGIREDGF